MQRILDLARRAFELWEKQPQEGKRELLDLLLSNCTWDGENLDATYRKPFCWLAEGSSRPNWLPAPDNCKNLVDTVSFRLQTGPTTPQEQIPAKAPPPRTPAIDVALAFQKLLDEGVVNSRAELARRFGMTRARVTQILNLLELPPSVVDSLSALPAEARAHYTERQLRCIVGLPTEWQQVKAFERLRKSIESSPC